MPRRNDLKSVLVIGSGPIVIGQAAEFDYSGTQAIRVLQEEGMRVILVNSNPATIMTDPDFADATYMEPVTPEVVEKIIKKERPDALLATLGGQTALNVAVSLAKDGILDTYNVELIGAKIDAIEAGEDREKFKEIVEISGAESARSRIVHTMDEAHEASKELGFPLVVRPSFTMGGLGSGIAYSTEDLEKIAGAGLHYSPSSEVLLEESILGWKEYELEMMRDKDDNVVVVCAIENFDPVGVHTGDSITVAPSMTLTDVEYQNLRDIAIKIIREVGVDTGGCNIQFAINPADGRVVVIEMNPRVSRSSALASKATGFPIAKIATKLSLGYTLDEIPNDITRETPASFEPTLDYVVVKVPRFTFEKFPAADQTLTTTMKSVGEAMAIGRDFTQALQKSVRSLEQKDMKFDFSPAADTEELSTLLGQMAIPTAWRLFQVQRALFLGANVEKIHKITQIDRWFLDQLTLINDMAHEITQAPTLSKDLLRDAKERGFSDEQIGQLTHKNEDVVRGIRQGLDIRPVYKTVDTCAGEFEAYTPYTYSSYDFEDEIEHHNKPSVIILGSGPNRIGQGVEFDYSCVHASLALQEQEYETVMINCNPETVSTDYDISTRLYFEPLTAEDVLEVIDAEEKNGGVLGVFVQLGGQTPLKLASTLEDAGVKILGTSPEAIDLAEDRGKFSTVLDNSQQIAPKHGTAATFDEAKVIAQDVGYPVLIRPSYVLGGRGMEIVYNQDQLAQYLDTATEISYDHPALIDRFLEDAIEIDVDALYDGQELYLGGVMEHIEEAGVHSGDSSSVLPPLTLTQATVDRVREATEAIAEHIGVRGLLNIQFALASDILYVLEANPRASRTVPFVSKATTTPLAKAAALIGTGSAIPQLRKMGYLPRKGDASVPLPKAPVAVKEAVLPFNRFRTMEGTFVDSLLGPEMKSTGEVMGIDKYFDTAFAKGQTAAGIDLPTEGKVFVSVADRDKRSIIMVASRLKDLGFEIVSTGGTAEILGRNGINTTVVDKVAVDDAFDNSSEDTSKQGKNIVDLIEDNEISLVFNTPTGGQARGDGYAIRSAAMGAGIPVITTMAEISVALQAIEALGQYNWTVRSLQEYGKDMQGAQQDLSGPTSNPSPVGQEDSKENLTDQKNRANGQKPPVIVGPAQGKDKPTEKLVQTDSAVPEDHSQQNPKIQSAEEVTCPEHTISTQEKAEGSGTTFPVAPRESPTIEYSDGPHNHEDSTADSHEQSTEKIHNRRGIQNILSKNKKKKKKRR